MAALSGGSKVRPNLEKGQPFKMNPGGPSTRQPNPGVQPRMGGPTFNGPGGSVLRRMNKKKKRPDEEGDIVIGKNKAVGHRVKRGGLGGVEFTGDKNAKKLAKQPPVAKLGQIKVPPPKVKKIPSEREPKPALQLPDIVRHTPEDEDTKKAVMRRLKKRKSF